MKWMWLPFREHVFFDLISIPAILAGLETWLAFSERVFLVLKTWLAFSERVFLVLETWLAFSESRRRGLPWFVWLARPQRGQAS